MAFKFNPFTANLDMVTSLSEIDRLTSITATAGDTLILTSDNTNQQLQWSRNLAQLKFTDSTSTDVIRLYASNDTTAGGLFVNGHMMAGRGTSLITSRPQVNHLLSIAEDTSDTWDSLALTGGFNFGLVIEPQLNADLAQVYQTYTLARYSYRLNVGFDSTDGAGGGLASNLTGAQYLFRTSMVSPMVGSITNIIAEEFDIVLNMQATVTPVTEFIGIKFTNLSVTNPVPTRGVGIRFGAPSGTTAWAIQTAGKVQFNTVTQLIFGGTNTAQGVNYIARGGTNDINMGLAALTNVHYNWSATAYTPQGTIRTQFLGDVTTKGWAGLYLQDTAASFTALIQSTNTGISGDRTLTLDLKNGNQTLKWNTNSVTVTIDDWFNQSVKTTASPQFNGVGLGVALPATTWLAIAAGATGYSQIQLASGVAPTTPVAGDMWYDGTSLAIYMGLNIKDASNVVLGTTTGTKFGTATTQKLAFYNSAPIVQGAALTAQLTSLTHTAPGTPDYAIADLTNVAPFGFTTKDEGNTVLSVILNLQTRVAQLEARLGSATGVGLFA